MAKSEPLRNRDDIQKIKNYLWRKGNLRDYTLFILGVNTALRIGDLLQLRWGDVMDAATGKFFNHVVLTEQKTKKQNSEPDERKPSDSSDKSVLDHSGGGQRKPH